RFTHAGRLERLSSLPASNARSSACSNKGAAVRARPRSNPNITKLLQPSDTVKLEVIPSIDPDPRVDPPVDPGRAARGGREKIHPCVPSTPPSTLQRSASRIK